jgi:hypothetical protein
MDAGVAPSLRKGWVGSYRMNAKIRPGSKGVIPRHEGGKNVGRLAVRFATCAQIAAYARDSRRFVPSDFKESL